MRTFKPYGNCSFFAIQASDCTKLECSIVQSVVCNQYMDSDDYKLRTACGAFLQGISPAGNGRANGWILVEFITQDKAAVDAFVEHLNKRINNPTPIDHIDY